MGYNQVADSGAVVCQVAHVTSFCHAYVIGAGGRFVNNDVGGTCECGNFHILNSQGDAVSVGLTTVVVHNVDTNFVGCVAGSGWDCSSHAVCHLIGCCGGCCQRHAATPGVGVVCSGRSGDGGCYGIETTAVGADVACNSCNAYHRSLMNVDSLCLRADAVGLVVLDGDAHGLVTFRGPAHHNLVGVGTATGSKGSTVDIPSVGVSSQALHANFDAVVGKRRGFAHVCRCRECRYHGVIHQYRYSLLLLCTNRVRLVACGGHCEGVGRCVGRGGLTAYGGSSATWCQC